MPDDPNDVLVWVWVVVVFAILGLAPVGLARWLWQDVTKGRNLWQQRQEKRRAARS